MSTGSSAPPQTTPPAQGFAAFAPQTGGFAAVASGASASGFGGSIATTTSGTGFSFGVPSTPAAPATSGFGFGGSSSTTSKPTPTTSGSGFSFRGSSPSVAPSGSLFGPPRGFAPSEPSPFWKPPAPAATAVSPPGGAIETSNPLGRGLSTRACFAVNDDQRFTKPAFQASKPSAWALVASIAAHNAATPLPPAPTPPIWFSGVQNTPSVPAWGEKSPFDMKTANPSVPAWGEWNTVDKKTFAPTPIVEANGQAGRFMSISAMPAHENESVEELRFSTRDVARTQPSTSFEWRRPVTTSPAVASSGFAFGVDRNSTGMAPGKTGSAGPITTVFGSQPASATTTVDSGNPFARPSEPAKPTSSLFGSDGRTATVSSGGGFLFGSKTSPSTSLFGVVPSGNTSGTSTAGSDGGLFAPRAPGTFTPLFGPPSTTAAAPSKPSLFWRPPTEALAPLPPPRKGFLFGTNEPWTGISTSQPEQTPLFSFVKTSGEESTSSVRFGANEPTAEQAPTADATSGPVGVASTSPNGAELAEEQAVQSAESTSTSADAESDPNLLALPRLTQSYSNISGSRAKAFVRRAGAIGSKSFGTQGARLAVAAMTSSRKFSQELSPMKKPIERIVVGRRDAELWKHSGSHFRSSLFAKSANATATAFAAEMQSREIETPDQTAEKAKVEHAVDVEIEKKTMEKAGSLDLENYDL